MDASLKDLGTDYVDLYLMHWPSPFARGDKPFPKKDGKVAVGDTDYVDTYKAMEKLYKSGKAKAIGISNFSKAELERLLSETSVVCLSLAAPSLLKQYLPRHRFQLRTKSNATLT